ncbi:helix-turn-helix domain-containing protein [Paenibacillus sp. strain BS8-2]
MQTLQIDLKPSPELLLEMRELFRAELATVLGEREAAPTAEAKAPKRRAPKKIHRAEDLPDICSPQIAADFLGIGRQRVYEFCQKNPEYGGIKSYTIGGQRKIDRPDLIEWKERQKRDNAIQFAEMQRGRA